MRVKFIIFCSLWILGFPLSQQAQVSLQDSSIRLGVFRIGYALTVPGQEWANRFGTSHSINLEGGIQFSNRLVLSLEGGYLFGNNISEEGILSSIRLTTCTVKVSSHCRIYGSDSELYMCRHTSIYWPLCVLGNTSIKTKMAYGQSEHLNYQQVSSLLL